MRKKKTAVWFYPAIDDVDAKQYHRASFSTRNSALNTSLRKPIRMQDFIQLCDSVLNEPTNDDVFDDFRKISDHFPKIFQNCSEGKTNVSEDFRGGTKMFR